MENTVENTETTEVETKEVLLEKVESSNIQAIGFEMTDEADAKGTLYVKFSEGQVYSYTGVSAMLADELMASESKGAFFASNIKGKAKFPHTKMGAEFKHKVVEAEVSASAALAN